jgi:hypothetical protein
MMSRVHAKAGNVFWGKGRANDKAERNRNR